MTQHHHNLLMLIYRSEYISLAVLGRGLSDWRLIEIL
jgi:hypothetical protein